MSRSKGDRLKVMQSWSKAEGALRLAAAAEGLIPGRVLLKWVDFSYEQCNVLMQYKFGLLMPLNIDN
jgi:hypothetical protein